MKSSDIFIGIVEFFSTLLPGIFLVGSLPSSTFLRLLGSHDAASDWAVPRWVVLVGVGYAVGQMLHLLGAKLASWTYPPLLRWFKPAGFDDVCERAVAVLARAFPTNIGSEITRRGVAVVKQLNPELAVELERLEAAAKFARGLALVAVILAVKGGVQRDWTLAITWSVIALLAFVRFIDRRLIHNRYACELLVLTATFSKTPSVPSYS